MKCPRHGEPMLSVRLDVYYCPVCDHDWLIHEYKTQRKGF